MPVRLKIEGFFPVNINEHIEAYGRQDLNDENLYEINQINVVSNNITYERTQIDEHNVKLIGDVTKCIITDRGYKPGKFFTYITIQDEQIDNV